MTEFWDTLGQLIVNLATLGGILAALAWRWALLIVWVAWWLFAVDWRKAWPVLARGAWAPVVLLLVVAALVWSRIVPGSWDRLGFISVAGFWWHLGGVAFAAAVALLCGWLQGLLHIIPPEVAVEPVITQGPGHEHPVGTFHGHEYAHSDEPHPERAH